MSTSISQAFKSLNVSTNSQDHENIYEISYQYLSKVKKFNDIKSFNNCIVALINLEKYQKALDLINKIKDDDIIEEFSIEVAYIYYKTNESQRLQQLYEKINGKSSKYLIRGLKHILAQDYYKIGENKKALELYEELISSNEIDNNLDLATNELAIISQIKFLKNEIAQPVSTVEDLNNYDYLFNKALIQISNGNLLSANELINKSIDILQSSGLEGEDLDLERGPLLLVKAIILNAQGEKDESLSILDDLKTKNIDDLLLTLIIKNNSYSFSKVLISKEYNLVHRDLNYQQNISKLSDKLSFIQNASLLKNNLLLSYLSNTLSPSSNYLKNETIKKFLTNGDFSLLNFKTLIKLGITNDDLEYNSDATSRKLFKSINNTEVTKENFQQLTTIAFSLLSQNLKQQKYNQSLISLEKLVDFSLNNELLPALVGSLINLYEKLDLNDKLTTLFEKLYESFKPSDIELFDFYKVTAFKLLNLGNIELSNKLFTKLNEINPSDSLIKNILNNNNEGLVDIETLTNSVDESIISTDINTLVPTTTDTIPSIKPRTEKRKVTKPKFGKNKVIKPIDEVTLDEERWLPMTVRSYYKPKKSKKKMTSHQGVVETPTPTQSPAPPSNPPSTTKKANKKKKKGKK